MKKTIIAIISVIATFIVVTLIVSFMILNSSKILKNFSIISVSNIGTKYNIKFEKVKAAKYYDLIIYNEDSSIFYNKSFYKTNVSIDLKNIEYDKKYKLLIIAYDKDNNSQTVNNPYKFTYSEPTIDLNNNLILNDKEDYILFINGTISNKDYSIKVLNSNNNVLLNEKLKDNDFVISKDIFKDLEGVLTVNLYENNNIISTIDLYSKISPVSDLVITSPINDSVLDYNDVAFTYTGGKNATKYVLKIYHGKNLIKEKTIKKNRCVISSEFFKKGEKYKINISAIYEGYDEYTKDAEVTFKMNEKDTLKPVYIDKYYKSIKPGASIELLNPNSDGTIYYTIDGTDPIENGLEYKGPIIVYNDMILKAFIKSDKKNNSIIKTFDIKVNKNKVFKVYLSPSNQINNIGLKDSGYRNESVEMNEVTDYIEKKLNAKGVKVYRNNPDGNINIWNSESKYYNCDIHLAIHSNASETRQSTGFETWVNEQASDSYSLANIIQSSLSEIYYNETGNRGVKYANGSIGEVNDLYVDFGLLVEIGFHDNINDIKWMLENKELIGNTIAESILSYFDIN